MVSHMSRKECVSVWVVELHQGGSATNGATPSSFYLNNLPCFRMSSRRRTPAPGKTWHICQYNCYSCIFGLYFLSPAPVPPSLPHILCNWISLSTTVNLKDISREVPAFGLVEEQLEIGTLLQSWNKGNTLVEITFTWKPLLVLSMSWFRIWLLSVDLVYKVWLSVYLLWV